MTTAPHVSLTSPELIGRTVIDRAFGAGTEWEEPNEYGEEGFTRAQAESDIEADDIRTLIEAGIAADRRQIAVALEGMKAVPPARPYPRASISELLDAYAEWDGEVDTFVLAWQNYTAGLDTPCTHVPHGIHSTYLTDDGSCDYCGEKNRG